MILTEDQARTALGEVAAHALARMAGWIIELCGPVVPPVLAAYSFCHEAGLMIGYWRPNIRHLAQYDAVRETRADLLVVEPRDAESKARFDMRLYLCRDGEVQIYEQLQLWTAGRNAPLWLVPGLADAENHRGGFCFQPHRLNHAATLPFTDPVAAQTGFAIARDRWHAKITELRA